MANMKAEVITVAALLRLASLFTIADNRRIFPCFSPAGLMNNYSMSLVVILLSDHLRIDKLNILFALQYMISTLYFYRTFSTS